MKTMLGKAIYGAGTVALLGLSLAANTAVAQDKTIRVGITLRMMVESGMAYGDIAKSEIEAVRLIILGASPAIGEGIKWNVPSFRAEKDWFATFNVRARDSVQIIFHLGAKTRPDLRPFKLADPNGLMKWLGKDRAMVTLGSGRDIPANRKALEAIVRAWVKQL